MGLALLNFPICIAILAATLYLQVFVNKMPMQNLFIGFFESLTIHSLMAIPFFILAGNLMDESSLGSRLINLMDAPRDRLRRPPPRSAESSTKRWSRNMGKSWRRA